ncbi:MAG TPA: helix-hairpin-helix domain-containing protein, partial [Crinalium sp.]
MASKELLTFVSGITPTIANNIVAYRNENGAFNNRRQLLKV